MDLKITYNEEAGKWEVFQSVGNILVDCKEFDGTDELANWVEDELNRIEAESK